ncbi:helix-turn-helix domain-containing protein [Streptomyces xiaopingdaonensis]|uniref:helix-turn-helix domain-containing protein n=1 Tax=Streptomyces xiaopingdaonensis TaxID=1565415 RepID=UPI00307A8DDB
MSLSENVRNHRRRAGLGQEQLAEEAGVSVGVVRKVEQGGNVRVETLHALARALGTTTSSLFATGVPEPDRGGEGDDIRLLELRRALMPPVGLAENRTTPREAKGVEAIQREIEDSHSLYHADRYDSVAKKLPGILRSLEAAVSVSEDDDARRKALGARSQAFSSRGST